MTKAAIVLEWENAIGLERERALQFLHGLADKVRKAKTEIEKPVELIVVFDERVDVTVLKADFKSIAADLEGMLLPRFLFTPKTPYYEKKGVSAKVTDADIIVYADSDCSYSENWLDDIIAPVLDGTADVAAGYTQALEGSNFVERVCELAWFFPTSHSSDPMRAKTPGRLFGNNFAVTKSTIDAAPIPRVAASRSHGGLWVDTVRKKGLRIHHVAEAVAMHKQYDNLGEFFGRAWLLGKDKDAGVSLKSTSRPYRVLRAVTAFFELTVKYLRRFFKVGLSIHSVWGFLPAMALGLLFQWTAALSQLVAALTRPVASATTDYDPVLQRTEFV